MTANNTFLWRFRDYGSVFMNVKYTEVLLCVYNHI
jgi:hypothetical protein